MVSKLKFFGEKFKKKEKARKSLKLEFENL
jgi:hypothetical protein